MSSNNPERAYMRNPHNGLFSTSENVVCFVRGERGFYPICCDIENAAAMVERMNKNYGATGAHVAAYHIGSLCGWHVPGANPVIYDENGNFKNLCKFCGRDLEGKELRTGLCSSDDCPRHDTERSAR